MQGVTNTIQCMAQDCEVIAPEDFVLSHVNKPNMREGYQQFMFKDHVKSHPQLRFCPGPNCQDCPNCHVNIEKNGGCNFMQCYSCKHTFYWVCRTNCMSDSGCNRYRERPPENPTRLEPARKALEKYLHYVHYYTRWENHAKSRKLEEKAFADLQSRIHDQVKARACTWIDWQYTLDAARLLKRCRYTLQYSYSHAYYMEDGPRKELFEYQQAQLEADIEKLSWMIKRPERSVGIGIELKNQIDIAEKRWTTLLKDFSEFSSNTF